MSNQLCCNGQGQGALPANGIRSVSGRWPRAAFTRPAWGGDLTGALATTVLRSPNLAALGS
jgi:hypothetical protein